jgi:hypothetical protein
MSRCRLPFYTASFKLRRLICGHSKSKPTTREQIEKDDQQPIKKKKIKKISASDRCGGCLLLLQKLVLNQVRRIQWFVVRALLSAILLNLVLLFHDTKASGKQVLSKEWPPIPHTLENILPKFTFAIKSGEYIHYLVHARRLCLQSCDNGTARDASPTPIFEL